MIRRIVTCKWSKWSLLFAGATFGILPSGCEQVILRAVTPLLI